MELALAAVQQGDRPVAGSRDETSTVTGNALLLHELVANLVDNAIRYTPAGGRVALRVMRAADGARCWKWRTAASALPPSERERVFAPFYRAPGAQQVNPRRRRPGPDHRARHRGAARRAHRA